MKPQTLNTMTILSTEEIRSSVRELEASDFDCSDSSDIRDYATHCRDIIDVAEALENLLLTAADEIERIELARAETPENIQFVSSVEHSEMHSRKGLR